MEEVRTDATWRRRWEAVALVALAAIVVVELVVVVGVSDPRSGLRGQLLALLVPLAIGITWVGLLLNYREIRRQNIASREQIGRAHVPVTVKSRMPSSA